MQDSSRRWTEAEDTYLTDNYLQKTHAEMAVELGRSRPGVRNRCWRLGLQKKVAVHPPEVVALIRRHYENAAGQRLDLEAVAERVGIPRASVAGIASELGITERNRPKSEEQIQMLGRERDAAFLKRGHPRGMLGKRHSPEAKQKMSRSHTRRYAQMTPEARARHILAGLKTKHKRGTLLQRRKHASWKQGKYSVAGRSMFFRSAWEANYARYLQWQKDRGDVKDWAHEAETFWFEAVRRGVRTYTPDFRVVENDGSVVYHEVKGWMDERSERKLQLMTKYHPSVEIRLVDATRYGELQAEFGNLVPGWE